MSQKCNCSKEKGTVIKKPNLVCGGAWKFPQKIFAQRKCPDKLSLYQAFKSAVHNESFQLNIHDSTQPNRKTILTTKVKSFLQKKTHHFCLISFTGLTLRSETNDNHCKLKKTSALRPLVFLNYPVLNFCHAIAYLP